MVEVLTTYPVLLPHNIVGVCSMFTLYAPRVHSQRVGTEKSPLASVQDWVKHSPDISRIIQIYPNDPRCSKMLGEQRITMGNPRAFSAYRFLKASSCKAPVHGDPWGRQ